MRTDRQTDRQTHKQAQTDSYIDMLIAILCTPVRGKLLTLHSSFPSASTNQKHACNDGYRVSVMASGILKVEEYWRVSVLLFDVVPNREARCNIATVGRNIVQTRLGSCQQLSLFQHPPSLHALALTVQHECAEPVGQVVIGQELQVELVELKRHRKLQVNLQMK